MVWITVLSSSVIPELSWMTLAMRTKQLVMREGLLMILSELFILVMVNALHKQRASSEMMTFPAPPFEWAAAFYMIIKIPLDPRHQITLPEDGSGLPIDKSFPFPALTAVKSAMVIITLEHWIAYS